MSANQTSKSQLPEPKMPTIQRAFSKSAGRFRKIASRTVAVALIFIGVSTVASVFHAQSLKVPLLTYHVNLATGIAAVLFALAGLIRLYRIVLAPDRIWFGSRVLAERTRSLSWRYAVAGAPFPLTSASPDNTDERFQKALDAAAGEANKGGIRYRKPRPQDEIRVITDWMRRTRAKSLDDRQSPNDLRSLDDRHTVYATERILDQQSFYERRERENSRAAAISQWLLFIIEVVGAVLAGLNAFAVLNLDLVGVAGTVAAGVATWVQFNQFTELASTYGAMAYRMAGYRERCLSMAALWTEDRWAVFVGEVEDALGEENGAWQRVVQKGANGNP